MKNAVVVGLLVLMLGCTKEEVQVIDSVNGTWTYTTPDNVVAVTFDLVSTKSDNLEVQNLEFKLDGTVYQAETIISGVDLPAVGTLRFNTNDANAVYPYRIEFSTLTVSSDFKTITAQRAIYTWPYPTVKTVENVEIKRK